MYFECSNQHRFEAPQQPARCASIGCQSRIVRPSHQLTTGPAAPLSRADEESDLLASVFRIGMGLALVLCPIIYLLVGGSDFDDQQQSASDAAVATATMLGVVAGFSLLLAYACFLIGLYRSWQLVDRIRDKNAAVRGAPSPGMAVGLMLVPSVNVLWMFRAYGGLPRALNAVAQTYHLDARKMNQYLAYAPGVLAILAGILAAVASADELFSLEPCLVLLVASCIATYLFGHEMFSVTWDLRRKLTK